MGVISRPRRASKWTLPHTSGLHAGVWWEDFDLTGLWDSKVAGSLGAYRHGPHTAVERRHADRIR